MDNQLTIFYSCVVLVAALRPRVPKQERHAHPKAGWRRFLDDLCWFCDTETGGKSVVSVVTQKLRNKHVIWVACNADTTKPLKHLKWLLHKLTNAHLLSPSQLDKLEADIISESVRISYKKLKYHARLLELGLKDVSAARGSRTGQSF
nr:hypothetical protein CFP56_33419 [Quercus suber]